uniref:(California timema) hypothetical protein n=1 Tax=Timema californicum TaxID=61474 RepID=A0A7R9P2T5_TIMCA|nr:unnamed protein product [Timema californicum]
MNKFQNRYGSVGLKADGASKFRRRLMSVETFKREEFGAVSCPFSISDSPDTKSSEPRTPLCGSGSRWAPDHEKECRDLRPGRADASLDGLFKLRLCCATMQYILLRTLSKEDDYFINCHF